MSRRLGREFNAAPVLHSLFQMFVRLFVDENLDRMVPISKQPKEKIQAIIESCSRQFPEFQERARKRIRTYLKSCRRMKKNGMEVRLSRSTCHDAERLTCSRSIGLVWKGAWTGAG